MKTEERPSVPEPARGHDLFVSYSRADRERVIALTEGLAERGKRAWVDLEEIPPSAEWMAEIRSAIEAADGYLVVVSPALAGSKVCAEELEHARAAGKRIVPVLVRATDPESLPQPLAALNWIDATGPELDPALDRIVTALETDLEHTKGHTRLLVRASEWEHKGEDRSLLLHGSDLKQAEAFLVEAQGKEPAPTPLQARYIQASRQGTSRKQRALISGVSLALVVALVLSVVAIVQRSEAVDQRSAARDAQAEAERQAQVANSRMLAAQALVHMDRDLGLAILLSLEAYRTSPTEQALEVLHIAAQRSHMIERTLAAAGSVEFSQAGRKAVVFSPAGDLIASGGADGRITIWAADTGTVVGQPIPTGSGSVFAIDFSPDGNTVAAAGADGEVTQWDPRTGHETAPSIEVRGSVSALAFSSDGRVLAVGTSEGRVSLADAADGHTVAGPESFRPSARFKSITGLAFSPDAERLAIGMETGDLMLVDASNLTEARALELDALAVWSPEFSPDGRTLAAGTLTTRRSGDGEVLLWDVDSMRLVRRLKGHTDQVFDVSFSSNGRILGSASADATVRLWDLTTGEQVGEPLVGHSDDVHAVAFDPTGSDLVSGSSDGSVIVWDAGSRLVGGGGPVNVVAFAGDGSRLISSEPFSYGEPFPPDPAFDGGGEVLRWDTRRWTTIGQSIHGEYVFGLAVGPDGDSVVGGTIDGRILRGDVEGGPLADDRFPSAGDVVFGVAVSPDGGTIAGGTFEHGVNLWDARTGESVREPLSGYEDGVYGLAFAPDGATLATGDWSGQVRLWDTENWEPISEPLADGLQRVYAVTFDRAGTALASAGFSGSVIVWDTADWERKLELTIDNAVLSLAFSPDGAVLAAGTETGEVQFIDMATGEPIGGPVTGQRDWVNTVTFSPDGESLVAGSEDGSISLISSTAWSDDVAALGETLCNIAGRGLTEGEWDAFVPFKPYASGCPKISD